MAGASKIEWTDATWNPIVGCSIVSPGCTNCYAMRDAWRKHHIPAMPHYRDLTKKVNGNAIWTGKLAQAPDSILLAPLKRKKPTKYFVNSMGDLFHEDCPDEWIDKVFAIMALAPQHTFQVLTKREARMRDYLLSRNGMGNAALCKAINDIPAGMGNRHGALEMPLPNVWLGVSTERQQEADERIPLLLQTPAAVRFISAEPLLGPISLRWAKWDDWKGRKDIDHLDGARMLDWVICGGESGPNARPMHPDWARELRDQCHEAGVAFHFKQHGEWSAFYDRDRDDPDWRNVPKLDYQMGRGAERWNNLAGGLGFHGERLVAMRNVGKKAAGRLLDGREHNEFPKARAL